MLLCTIVPMKSNNQYQQETYFSHIDNVSYELMTVKCISLFKAVAEYSTTSILLRIGPLSDLSYAATG